MYAKAHARLAGDRPALIMGNGERCTYAEFEQKSNRLAHVFRDCGLQWGDHVSLILENSVLAVVAQGAAERTGLYYTPVNHHLTPSEAAWVINDSQARLVVLSSQFAPMGLELQDRCPRVEHWLMPDPPLDLGGFISLRDRMDSAPDGPVPDERLGIAMLYSSGTTGRPKGILRPMPDVAPDEPLTVWQTVNKAWKMRAGMVFLQPGPLYHSGPQTTTAAALRAGGTVVLMERFDPREFLALVDAHQVTHTMTVPTMLQRVLRLPAEDLALYDVSSLEMVAHGAAPCPPSVKRRLIEWLGPVVYESYGSTEAAGGTICDSHEWLQRPGTVGRAMLGNVSILSEEGQPCGPGEVGEIFFATDSTFEYFGDPEKTAEAWRRSGQLYRTGDVGWLDEDGYLFLADRKDFTINSGGVNIYPREVEDALQTHPDVQDVAVIGVPNDDFGEEVKAIVQLVDPARDADKVAAALDVHCAGTLARYKRARSYEFVDALPYTPSGKIDKMTLRELFSSGSTVAAIYRT